MNTTDISLAAFAIYNVLRIAAYFPQMVTLARRPGAALSFSYGTWVLFTAANTSTAVYAGAVLGDQVLSAVHAFSALCCGALIVLAWWRCRWPLTQAASALR